MWTLSCNRSDKVLSRRLRSAVVWTGVAVAIAWPIALATSSPLLAWRDPVYIAAGFAGIFALALLLVQPLLAARCLPGLKAALDLRIHRWIGCGLIVLVVIHVAALWVTSPPDVIDALLFRSPTPFSVWGVVAMWALFASGLVAAFGVHLRPRVWRLVHTALAGVIVGGSVAHALPIEGAMEIVSKTFLCVLVVMAAILAVLRLRHP